MEISKDQMERLNKAVERWEKIVRLEKVDAFCPLCRAGGFCREECVIRKDTGMEGCHGTPFDAWIKHHMRMHAPFVPKGETYVARVVCPVCKSFAEEELEYLRKLRDRLRTVRIPQPGEIWYVKGSGNCLVVESRGNNLIFYSMYTYHKVGWFSRVKKPFVFRLTATEDIIDIRYVGKATIVLQ